MFETTIEKDLQSAMTEAERADICMKIFSKYQKEFLAFIEKLKQSGIAQSLYNSSTPEETISLWKKYSSENQDLFGRIKAWAEGRGEYFNTHEPCPLFENNQKLDCILEIGLMILIVKDETLLLDEDINENFTEELVMLLMENPNPILKAAAYYIDCDGFDTITAENIFDFYPHD